MIRYGPMGARSKDRLELPTRAWRIFEEHGISTVGKIDSMTDTDLLQLPGFGVDTLKKVREAVNHFRERWHRGYEP